MQQRPVIAFLKPSVLSLTLLVVIAMAIFSGASTHMTISPGPGGAHESTTRLGIGSPIVITEINGEKSTNIGGVILWVNILAIWLLSTVLAEACIRWTGFKRPNRVYGITILGIVIVTLLVTMGITKYYWGYLLLRPGLPKSLDQIHVVTSVTPLHATNLAGRIQLTVNHDPQADYERFTDKMLADSKYRALSDYYCLTERGLVYFHQKDLLPKRLDHAEEPLPDLYAQLEESGMLAKSDPGYSSDGALAGFLISGRSSDQRILHFLGMHGGQVSNDHYPYYELLFEGTEPSLQVRDKQGFFYDIAGMEGAEGFGLWGALTMVASLIALPGLTIGAGLKRILTPASSPAG